ncbi:hypothetical protein T03_12618 [Trichinella britovi]|uniref:Uncharacterized protein n=1 Tax=Trichinella britovi TaxID=45882 RepID=A0A0V1CZI9_TRIBR|nr:hypothetical protein T03_12618 [Trichinella britovi]
MPGLGLPADSCFDSDAFQFCAVSRLSATPFRSAIIFSRRFHFTLLPLLNTEAVGCDDFPFHRRNVYFYQAHMHRHFFYHSERQCRIQSCRSTIGHTVTMALSMPSCGPAGRPAGLPACLPACRDRAWTAKSLAGLLCSLVSGLSGPRARRGDQCPRASKFRAI